MERVGDGDFTLIFSSHSIAIVGVLAIEMQIELLGLVNLAWAWQHWSSIYKQFRPDSCIYTTLTQPPDPLHFQPTPDLKPRSLLTVVVRSGGFMLIITFPIQPSHNMGSSVLTSNIPSIITKCYILIWGNHQAKPFCFETENLRRLIFMGKVQAMSREQSKLRFVNCRKILVVVFKLYFKPF